MTTPLPPHPRSAALPGHDGGDRSRAGARWITATGAFLLLAAAAVFVAVRWQELSDEVKLGILAAMTGGFLFAGRRARAALPATSGVLYHLGAFLVPLNTAAVAIGHDLAWEPFVLLEGATAALVWYALARVERSSILRWSAHAATVVALAGLSATLERHVGWTVPAALLVALAALIADRTGRAGRQAATAWALVAGLAPCAALAERALLFRTDVLTRLGLSGAVPQRAALASGLVAAYVLARAARRRHDLVLVVASAVSAGLGALTAWVALSPSGSSSLLTGAALFVMIELGAHAVRADDLWAAPARVVAAITELLGALALPILAIAAAVVVVVDPDVLDAPHLVAGGLAAVAWFVADLRRRTTDSSGPGIALLVGAGWWPATWGITASLLIGVAAGTASLTAVSITAVVLAGSVVLSGRSGGHLLAGGLAVFASATAFEAPWPATMAIGAAGGLVLAAAAMIRARTGDRALEQLPTWALAITSILPVLLARAMVDLGGVGPRTSLAAVVVAIVALWAVTFVLEHAEVDADTAYLGVVGRVGQLLAVLTAVVLSPGSIAIAAGVASALAVVDAVRRDDAIPLWTLVASLPLAVATAAIAIDGPVPHAGLALCGLTAAAVGAEILVPPRFRTPLVVVAAVSALLGLVLSASDLASFSTAAILLGGVGLAASVAHDVDEGALFAWTLVTAGLWGHLSVAGIDAIDAYVAPVALALVVVGIRAMRIAPPPEQPGAEGARLSSWIAFAPAIALLGGAALFERIDGAGGVHALVAGAVGLAAVIVGGGRRLIAPLLLGTALLVALTVHESLSVTRQVPTWGWLALGGTVLVTVGALLDRRDTSPLETGRRIADVVHERFS